MRRSRTAASAGGKLGGGLSRFAASAYDETSAPPQVNQQLAHVRGREGDAALVAGVGWLGQR
ncbi:hypothetical protein J8J27_25470, partial [Mycobacterium tuberculosis]|nr:hypothetical protein [Mycobacterium tuberculosis]